MAQREDDFLQLVRENEGRLRKICRVYADTEAAQEDLYQDILVSWVVRIGALVVMGWSGFTYWTLRRSRTGYAPTDVDQPVAEALRTEREKVDEQIRLLEGVLWWYILPPVVGVLLVVVGNAGLSWFTLGYGAFVFAIGAGIYYLNQREVRQNLRPHREALTRLLRQVEE